MRNRGGRFQSLPTTPVGRNRAGCCVVSLLIGGLILMFVSFGGNKNVQWREVSPVEVTRSGGDDIPKRIVTHRDRERPDNPRIKTPDRPSPFTETRGLQIYVDGDEGDDSKEGLSPSTALKTIQRAQEVVKEALSKASEEGDVYVHLKGDFPQKGTLRFDSSHSGRAGHRITYSPYPQSNDDGGDDGDQSDASPSLLPPRIHGGISIEGWKLHNSDKNIWMALSPSELSDARQIYVNGVRATRTNTGQQLQGSVRQTETGYVTNDDKVLGWTRVSRLEFVYTSSGSSWTEARCGVEKIKKVSEGAEIVMKQPCFRHASTRVHNQGVHKPKSVENVFELLGQEGRFYFDVDEGIIYYTPRKGEDMHTAIVIAPLVEVLMEAKGLEYVTFSGLNFEYAAWLEPSGNKGFPDIQAGCHYLGNPDMDSWIESPANIVFRASSHIIIEDCVFQHLGVTGVAFIEGSQHNKILENTFTDISCSAIQVGQVTDSLQRDPEEFNGYTLIHQNWVKDVAVEYRGCVGVFIGYVVNTTITHNDIEDLPYTGISIGWGWDAKVSYARDNVIAYNKIQNVMQTLNDGGGIYTLGPQPRSKVKNNCIHNLKHLYAGIYHDEGSAYFETYHNVITDVQEWLRLNFASAHDLDIHDCYTNQPNFHSSAKKSVIRDTIPLPPNKGNPDEAQANWPVEAINICKKAGRTA